MSDDKVTKLTAIAEEIKACTRCILHQERIQVVPGYGDANAEIMFIGEAPGAQEDKQGLPFVGRSGQYLDYLLDKVLKIERSQVFIANIVKCRPPGNRDPVPNEINACQPYLDRQIEIINPLVIATLGRFSMGMYFPDAKISQIHGQPRYDEVAGRAYYPFFHPAAALRNPNLRHDMEADMGRLFEVLDKVKAMRAKAAPEVKSEPDDEDPRQLPLF